MHLITTSSTNMNPSIFWCCLLSFYLYVSRFVWLDDLRNANFNHFFKRIILQVFRHLWFLYFMYLHYFILSSYDMLKFLSITCVTIDYFYILEWCFYTCMKFYTYKNIFVAIECDSCCKYSCLIFLSKTIDLSLAQNCNQS